MRAARLLMAVACMCFLARCDFQGAYAECIDAGHCVEDDGGVWGGKPGETRDAGGGDAGRVDGGPSDGGVPTDSGVGDGGRLDGGPSDAGTGDGGSDAGGIDDAGFDAGLMDAGPVDAGAPDAGPVDAGFMCTPLAPVSCPAGGVTLQRCNLAGNAIETVSCFLGCNTLPMPHCNLVIPTGIVPSSDLSLQGLASKTLTAATIVHTDNGLIEGGMRASNTVPSILSINSGIGFHIVTVSGKSVGVFAFDALTFSGGVKVVGPHPAVFLANGDIVVDRINASGDCSTANTPGPGGFASALGPGAGKMGMLLTFYGGGGGGAHADVGGKGATITSGGGAGGDGGAPYGSADLAWLVGGSGGGGTANAAGGAGGGAVQLVSQQAITIQFDGGISASGCGGRGAPGMGAGGGGAGGAILLEAPTVTVNANVYLVTGGGGGAGPQGNGNAGALDNTTNGIGLGGFCGSRCGGNGANLSSTAGANGLTDAMETGGGGGAVGRIRINSGTGNATLSSTGTLYIPSTTANPGLSQGIVAIQ